MMQGKMLIFSAPSGAGKTTIVHNLLNKNLNLEFSISATSRPIRSNEIHGKDYYFIPADEFKQKIAKHEFVEWEQVYENRFYGTLKSEVERIWAKGNHVIFDVDVVGGLNIKKKYPDQALSIFIMPPGIDELEKRLRLRSTDSNEDIETRIAKAKKEIEYAGKFDVVILNENLNKAIAEAENIVRNFINR
ncbi:MAG: guanylate kinase [Bacteroidetes bacterium GWC2_33_15]|nr:MAG: guanylate kinase [Bacteroidetes bacterium GWA2_33_15]OFX51025.1 MAG: guanylate kinase [Bacteroidetes bacterium GWC2_33_15]OFX65648.1 MAG: guanylate kinase [Bacteroidetes bacterium GWB2_32_14]OFX70233.1 MAG: guanylate kinase [Bacteroidetes bacterium GWD2_33_33]HAN17228.1 guanylate kinase [Bacteroidales bacterium]